MSSVGFDSLQHKVVQQIESVVKLDPNFSKDETFVQLELLIQQNGSVLAKSNNLADRDFLYELAAKIKAKSCDEKFVRLRKSISQIVQCRLFPKEIVKEILSYSVNSFKTFHSLCLSSSFLKDLSVELLIEMINKKKPSFQEFFKKKEVFLAFIKAHPGVLTSLILDFKPNLTNAELLECIQYCPRVRCLEMSINMLDDKVLISFFSQLPKDLEQLTINGDLPCQINLASFTKLKIFKLVHDKPYNLNFSQDMTELYSLAVIDNNHRNVIPSLGKCLRLERFSFTGMCHQTAHFPDLHQHHYLKQLKVQTGIVDKTNLKEFLIFLESIKALSSINPALKIDLQAGSYKNITKENIDDHIKNVKKNLKS